MQVKLFFVTVKLNCELHAVSVGNPSQQMSIFWMIRF